MLKINNRNLFSLILLFALLGCENLKSENSGEVMTTENGLKYQMLLDEEGENATIGDIITFEMVMLREDSIINSTYESKRPVVTPLQEPAFKGDITEGLMMMSAGDSAFFAVSIDSLFKGRMDQIPPVLQGITTLNYRIKMIKIQTEEEVKAEMEAKGVEQKSIDDKLITDYLAENGIEAEKTESGIYYVISQKGNGEHPSLENQVTVHYTGRLLDGSVFDSSKPENSPRQVSGEPISFPLSGVVKGWQEGIPLIEKGGNGFLYLPSHLAYGAQSPGPGIPPNSVLIFEVELIDIK
jgi:FKBP-type peptidyl-prolyl cis-trans isomerase FkpA